jgi:hypothetical protein
LLPLLVAVADEAHHILVAYTGQQLNLILELGCALHRVFLCPLDRDLLPCHGDAFVHLINQSINQSIKFVPNSMRYLMQCNRKSVETKAFF